MKSFDKVKLAWHNLKANKARSILTIIIVYVLGFLIMGLLFIGVSFSKNMNSVYHQLVKENKLVIYHLQKEDIKNLDEIDNVLEKYDDLISSVYLPVGNHEILDFKYFKEKGITIIKGDKPNSFENQAYVYLSSELESDYQIGDSYEVYENNFIVAGFFTSKIYFNSIIDLKYFHNNINPVKNFSIGYLYEDNRNFNQDLKNLNKFLDEIKKTVGSSEDIITRSDELENLNLIKMISTIIIVAIFFIATILILLSIGSLSNSIMISVDQNKKFIGLLKTLGLKDKDIKDLIVIETLFTVVFGILFASLTLILLIPLIENLILYLLEFFLRHVFYEVFATFNFQVAFPIYIPLLSILAFTLFSVLFSRTSIRKLVKSNPIEIINEVS